MAKLCQFFSFFFFPPSRKVLRGKRKSFPSLKTLKYQTNGSREMNAHNLKIVKLYSRTENYTAKRKMNFSNSMFFFIAHSLLLAYFRDILQFLTFFARIFVFLLVLLLFVFLLLCSFSCLVLGERESTFTLNFYDVSLAVIFFLTSTSLKIQFFFF